MQCSKATMWPTNILLKVSGLLKVSALTCTDAETNGLTIEPNCGKHPLKYYVERFFQ